MAENRSLCKLNFIAKNIKKNMILIYSLKISLIVYDLCFII